MKMHQQLNQHIARNIREFKEKAEALQPSKVKDMKDTEGLFFDLTK